nr:uncharacterized mitochondrial protein AtMg00810-like [Tanacetum cinerariifolium]
VEKAMYGLHQAPRAWYGTLSKYLLKNGFQRGTIDQSLFIRRQREDFILVQVYMDEIIFGSSNPQLCREFEALMHDKFQMSAMGELNFFLGLQVLQKEDGIFLSQDKKILWGKDGPGKDVELHLYRSMIGSLMYLTASRPDIMFAVCACARHQVTPTECHLHTVKRIFQYLKRHPKLRLWYPKASSFDLVAYSDSDYGGASQDRKSTTGGSQFLGRRLISWQCKKQTIVATSTTEAEYVAAASCCGQVLWIQNQLLDYGKHTAKTFDLVWIWLGGDYGNVFHKGYSWDSVINMCKNYLHGSLNRKSTTGGCQFLGRRLISWQCKKQIIVATSTTEAEYVAAASGYGQVLWIQNQLLDYGYA